jgi:hypothetical protein
VVKAVGGRQELGEVAEAARGRFQGQQLITETVWTLESCRGGEGEIVVREGRRAIWAHCHLPMAIVFQPLVFTCAASVVSFGGRPYTASAGNVSG